MASSWMVNLDFQPSFIANYKGSQGVPKDDMSKANQLNFAFYAVCQIQKIWTDICTITGHVIVRMARGNCTGPTCIRNLSES